MVPRLSRALFALVAAVSAAAAADPFLEGLSNAGAFGPGLFTDHSTIDVWPAAFVAVVLAGVVVALLARMRWTRYCVAVLNLDELPRLIPAIFVLQIGALFSMETIEQFVVFGHTLGGTVWLGAPAAVSLIVHLFAAIAATFVLSRALQWLAESAVRVARDAVAFLQRLLAAGIRILPHLFALPTAYSDALLRILRGRAPPFAATA